MQTKIRKTIAAGVLSLAIGFLFLVPQRILALEADGTIQKKQIVFLLDASKSMESDGQWEEAADSACMIAAALPKEYETALLVYNTEIIYQEDFGRIGQVTRQALADIKLQGYSTPDVALDKAIELFDDSAAEKRAVFISDGEIAVRDKTETAKEIEQFQSIVTKAVEQKINIDMFAIPTTGMENHISYATDITSGKLYTAEKNKSIGQAAADYLFEGLQIGKIELGEAVSDQGTITVDLQDTYMETAKILLLSEGELIQEFRVAGQCERLTTEQGNRFAVAELKNPLEKQIVLDYRLENRGNVRIYLIKEYYLKTNMEKSYTAEDGRFSLRAEVLNHQGKSVLGETDIRESVSIFLDGKQETYEVKNGTAIIPYTADQTTTLNVRVDIDSPGSIIHFDNREYAVTLTVPVVEEPDYTLLWIVVVVLSAVIFLLTVLYERRQQKKKSAETGTVIVKHSEPSFVPKHDFSGQLAVYLLKGETEEDIPPCRIKLFGRSRKSITFDWIKDRCELRYKLEDADKIRFWGGGDHALCFQNVGYATIVKDNKILKREQKYSLYYGEKLLLIFNHGGTEIELHYKNIKPSER